MAARTLSRDRLAFGRAVLLATDSVGLSPEGAFWLENPDEKKWDYFLVTSIFGRVGPRQTFLKLTKTLKEKLSEHEIEEFTFYIADPSERLTQQIHKAVQTGPHSSEPQETIVELDNKRVRAIIYRMTDKLTDAKAKDASRRLNRFYNELQVA